VSDKNPAAIGMACNNAFADAREEKRVGDIQFLIERFKYYSTLSELFQKASDEQLAAIAKVKDVNILLEKIINAGSNTKD
jgi:hypothetical protein